LNLVDWQVIVLAILETMFVNLDMRLQACFVEKNNPKK